MASEVTSLFGRPSVTHYIVAASLSAVLAVYVKARYFSPIRDVPGPFLAYFGTSWQLWHVLKGDYATAVEEVHKRYGKKLVTLDLGPIIQPLLQVPLRVSVITRSQSMIQTWFKQFSAHHWKRVNSTESLTFQTRTMSTSCPRSITSATRKRGRT